MTINDGVIKVVSTDDALNATGGNSGMMMPGGNFGGNGEENNWVLPEGFERGQRRSDRQIPRDDKTAQEQGTRPQRGENGQFGTMRPDGENPFGGEFVPPFQIPENSGFTPPEGGMPQMGGMGRDMKECLIINGGYLELCGNDDCVDTNGNMTINGGTVKATNPTGAFTGNFGVLDADGKIKISENANIILASNSGSEKSLNLSQNVIIVHCENNHEAGEKITVSDSSGNVVYEYAPEGGFRTVLIASNAIKTGKKYLITVGSETYETEITQQSTTIGTQTITPNMGFGRGQRMQ